MKELVEAMNKTFGDDAVHGAIFFHHGPDGKVDKISPLISNCATTQQLVTRLLMYSDAVRAMAEDLVKQTLPKN